MVTFTESQREAMGDDSGDGGGDGGGGGGGTDVPTPEEDTSPDRSGAGPTQEEAQDRQTVEAMGDPDFERDVGGTDVPTPEEDTSPDRSGAGPTQAEIDRRESPTDADLRDQLAGMATNPQQARDIRSAAQQGIETGETQRGNRVTDRIHRQASAFEQQIVQRGQRRDLAAAMAFNPSEARDLRRGAITDRSDVRITFGDSVRELQAGLTAGGERTFIDQQRGEVAAEVSEETGATVTQSDVGFTGDAFVLGAGARREVAQSEAERQQELQEQAAAMGYPNFDQPGFQAGASAQVGGGIQDGDLSQRAMGPSQIGQVTRAPAGGPASDFNQSGSADGIVEGLPSQSGQFDLDVGAGAARDVTPHAQMTFGQGEGLQARSAQEEVFAERAESGWERLLEYDVDRQTTAAASPLFDVEGVDEEAAQQEVSGNVPTSGQIGAGVFQAGEIAERAFGELGSEIEDANPLQGAGPEIGDESVGSAVGNLAGGLVSGVGMAVGAPAQLPVTVQPDRGTRTETSELEQPPSQLAAPQQVQEDASVESIERQIASMNPGVESEDINVTRADDGFDVDADLSQQDIRERVSAFNPDTDPSDVWFTESGDPMATTISASGVNPTVAGGGTVASGVQTAEAQGELLAERPLSTSALLFAPAAVRGGRGFQRGLSESGVSTVPTPTIQRFSVGDVGGVSVGVSRSTGKVSRTQPVVSAARGTEGRTPFEVGTPEARPSRALTEDVTPDMSAIETGVFTRALERSGAEAEASRIRAFRETQARTQRSGLRPRELESGIGDVLESQGVPREAAREVVDLTRAEEGQIYGSLVQRASAQRVGEPGVARTPRDIDIGEVSSARNFAQRATERINEIAGEEVVRLEDGTPTSVETGSKIFDIHEAGAETAVAESPTARSDIFFGVRSEPTVRTAEGIETTTLSEQTARKGQGAMEQFSPEARQVGEVESLLTPGHAGRVKDIPDFFLGERANIRGLELRGRQRAAETARGSLETFVESFGPEVQQRIRSEGAAVAREGEAPTTQLADFTRGEPAPGTRASPAPAPIAAGAESPTVSVATESPAPSPSPGITGGSPQFVSPSPFGAVGGLEAVSSRSPFTTDAGSAGTSVFGGPSEPSASSPAEAQSVSGPSAGESPPIESTAPSMPSTPFSSGLPSSPSVGTPSIPSMPSTPSTPPGPPWMPSIPTVPGPSTDQRPPPRAVPSGRGDEDEREASHILPTGTGFTNPVVTGEGFLFGGLL